VQSAGGADVAVVDAKKKSRSLCIDLGAALPDVVLSKDWNGTRSADEAVGEAFRNCCSYTEE
jgi:hypothetical protein